MHISGLACAALLLALPALGGCSKPAATASMAAMPTVVPSPVLVTPAREDSKACDLVTSQEMSAILDGEVVGAEPAHKSSGQTECVYSPTKGASPYAEFSVQWGEAETAFGAAGATGKSGVSSPYAGVGDQAMTVGPTLWVRSGKDLVIIVISGADDVPAKAKQIFDTAKARL